eukprot:TRINITY_DN11253_c0_g1_i1.p1 TRINITY_DN11253_c0_g1~~TRINITY_DN11253_c0_g1_i1.p1  ORF type:complete len:227 (-),score=59.83 TRINITY_DN11253_c0_g1_i1:40-720(-)
MNSFLRSFSASSPSRMSSFSLHRARKGLESGKLSVGKERITPLKSYSTKTVPKSASEPSNLVKNLLKNNEKFASSFALKDMPVPPKKKLMILTCMDCRIDPLEAMGLGLGDAHIIRNAGGRAQEAVRSIVISQQLLGTEEVVILHHTGCGLHNFKDKEFKEKLNKELGVHVDEHLSFLPFTDLEESVREDVEFLENCPLLIKGMKVWGGVYHVEDGRITGVDKKNK